MPTKPSLTSGGKMAEFTRIPLSEAIVFTAQPDKEDESQVNCRLKVNFYREQITQPILYGMGRSFDIIYRIRRANVLKNYGWVITDITGQPSEVQKSIQYLIDQGVLIQNLPYDSSYPNYMVLKA
jgi:L-aspartate semialdehyde sulfurtransferase ferredoxin